MIERLRNRWILFGCLLLVLSLAAVACARLAPTILPSLNPPSEDAAADAASGQLVPVAAATPSSQTAARSTSGLQSVTVQRGTIAEQVALSGRVAGSTEYPVTFPGVGKVESVPIKPGDNVKEGQLLVQTAAADISNSLDLARAKLQTDEIRLQQGQAQAAAQDDARRREAASRQQDAATRKQAAVADAEAALAAARAEQQKVAAGPSDSEKRSAQVALTTAHANVQRAQADVDRLTRGADPAQVRLAQHDVDAAQNETNRAQQNLNRLNAGPDPDAITAAQREVQRAQNALTAAQADKGTTGAAHDAAVANARLTLQDAQDRLAKASAPVDPQEIATAKLTLQAAQATLENAKGRLAALQQGPDQDSIDSAQAALDAAEKTEQNAQALVDDVNSHPTAAETQAAARKVAAAAAALDRARSQPMPDAPADDPTASYELVLLQNAVDQDHADIDRLTESLTTTRLVAPFDGTVASLSIKVGDQVDVGQPVVTLVKPEDPIVRVELTDKDAARLAVGQTATVKVVGSSGNQPLEATLATLSKGAGDDGKAAQFRVNWSGKSAVLGSLAQLQVTVQSKSDVLLVPRKAIRTVGSRQYVQYQDGPSRKTANVEVGMMTGDAAEIVSGLTEGQVVLVGP
jgi:multidrug resistance efflux pump